LQTGQRNGHPSIPQSVDRSQINVAILAISHQVACNGSVLNKSQPVHSNSLRSLANSPVISFSSGLDISAASAKKFSLDSIQLWFECSRKKKGLATNVFMIRRISTPSSGPILPRAVPAARPTSFTTTLRLNESAVDYGAENREIPKHPCACCRRKMDGFDNEVQQVRNLASMVG
jgi:hypothetical protein